MLNVASLRPSDIERLQSQELTDEIKGEILAGLQGMFETVHADGGADSDRIYMSAQMLHMAGVWGKISAVDLANALTSVRPSSRSVFLEGLPHMYAAEVALVLVKKEQDVSVGLVRSVITKIRNDRSYSKGVGYTVVRLPGPIRGASFSHVTTVSLDDLRQGGAISLDEDFPSDAKIVYRIDIDPDEAARHVNLED